MGKKSYRHRQNVQPTLEIETLFGDSLGRKADKKERQLCRQVQEAIAEALSTLDDEVLLDIWIESVEPSPDASRLLVLLRAPNGILPALAKERIEKVSGYLRTEVAFAITRKKAPTLMYEVLPEGVTQ